MARRPAPFRVPRFDAAGRAIYATEGRRLFRLVLPLWDRRELARNLVPAGWAPLSQSCITSWAQGTRIPDGYDVRARLADVCGVDPDSWDWPPREGDERDDFTPVNETEPMVCEDA